MVHREVSGSTGWGYTGELGNQGKEGHVGYLLLTELFGLNARWTSHITTHKAAHTASTPKVALEAVVFFLLPFFGCPDLSVVLLIDQGSC